MDRRKYKIKREMPEGDQVALEFAWTGALTVPLGSVSAGGQRKGNFRAFLVFRREGSCASGTTTVMRPRKRESWAKSASTRVLFWEGVLWYRSAIVSGDVSRQYWGCVGKDRASYFRSFDSSFLAPC